MLMDRYYRPSETYSSVNMYSWYFSKEEIEWISPSRKDGIDQELEEKLRHLYCSFIRDVGIKLCLPQLTIATATVFCHRFYLHQSHARNGWQTIATACIFLASKVEDTIVGLDDVVRTAYEMMFIRNPAAAWQIYQKDVFQKQKALILVAERLLLTTIRFDFNVQHPYRPLLDAMKKLGISQAEIRQAAWNFVTYWLHTTLYFQYKPHYIAAGCLYLAADLYNVMLPTGREHAWWHHFDVNPRQLDGVIQQMKRLLGMKQTSGIPVKKPMMHQHLADEAKRMLLYSSPDSVLSDFYSFTCLDSRRC